MDREEMRGEETIVHVKAWMNDERVLVCFFVDPRGLEGLDTSGGTITSEEERMVLSG